MDPLYRPCMDLFKTPYVPCNEGTPSYMDPLWASYRPLWTPYGPMDPYINPMDPLWTPYGPPKLTLWTPYYGPPMDNHPVSPLLWTPHGPPI
jgi:hypothetical protein